MSSSGSLRPPPTPDLLTRTANELGKVVGGATSPLLANIFLHYAYDLWADRWRRRHATGEVIIVRYADDQIVGFEHRRDAEQFLADLRERLAPVGLRSPPPKTRAVGVRQ